MAENNIKSVIEALLFASDKPLNLEQMKAVLDMESSEIKKNLEELISDYALSAKGMRIIEIAGGYQMTTAADFAPFLKKLYKGRNTEKLSKPALETLAIIAYKQPLTRMEIELLRNVNVDGVMKSLTEKNLVRITGRKKAPGRPLVYGTTRLFLEHFGLNSLDDLPKMEDFSHLAEKKDLVEIESIDEKQAEELNEPSKSA